MNYAVANNLRAKLQRRKVIGLKLCVFATLRDFYVWYFEIFPGNSGNSTIIYLKVTVLPVSFTSIEMIFPIIKARLS
jgi:hypothetical protein